MDHRLVLVHTVDHNRTTTTNVVDTVLGDLLHSRSLDDDVEPVWVVLLELLPLRTRVLSVELDVLVASVQFLCNVHLDTLVGGDDDSGCPVEFQQLSEDKTGGSSAQEKDVDANRGVELVQSVNGAGSGLKESGFFVCEVVDLVAFVGFAVMTSLVLISGECGNGITY